MWTGDKVISKLITRSSLEDITEVLKRPVVIWDNEHANDYDQKRVFLGTFICEVSFIINPFYCIIISRRVKYFSLSFKFIFVIFSSGI